MRGEPISYAEAVRGEFAPFHVGEAWGPPWSTTWFRVRGRVPDSWAGRRVVAQFDLGFDGPTGFTCEALAWKDGKPWRGVEADCNLPSGESLVRQLLLGKRFFMEEFGYETKILWLPDVFGYPGNLPQLISEAGCDYFLTQKLSWNDTNKPEHHTFIWEGIDGTRIFTHFPPADTYNGSFSPGDIERSIRNYKDGHSSSRSLYLFGWGDGGGGPQPEMIESAHRLGVEIGHAVDFFEAASAEANDLSTSSASCTSSCTAARTRPSRRRSG